MLQCCQSKISPLEEDSVLVANWTLWSENETPPPRLFLKVWSQLVVLFQRFLEISEGGLSCKRQVTRSAFCETICCPGTLALFPGYNAMSSPNPFIGWQIKNPLKNISLNCLSQSQKALIIQKFDAREGGLLLVSTQHHIVLWNWFAESLQTILRMLDRAQSAIPAEAQKMRRHGHCQLLLVYRKN